MHLCDWTPSGDRGVIFFELAPYQRLIAPSRPHPHGRCSSRGHLGQVVNDIAAPVKSGKTAQRAVNITTMRALGSPSKIVIRMCV